MRYVDHFQSMKSSTFHWQDDILAESLFDVFDEDKSGALNFYEFMLVKVTTTWKLPSSKSTSVP